MPSYRYVVADVFTDRPLTGNQLAVFTDARDLPEELMLPLARELAYSETAFVLPAEADGHVRIRIFTPRSELAFWSASLNAPSCEFSFARAQSRMLSRSCCGGGATCATHGGAKATAHESAMITDRGDDIMRSWPGHGGSRRRPGRNRSP